MTASESTQAEPKAKVLIIGDLLIDRTYYVDVTKLSPEAPIPVAMLTGKPIDTPGGAGLAAAFSAVDKIPSIFATYTSLEISTWMSSLYNLPIIHPHTRSENTNAIKVRYIDNERHYHLLRVDNDKTIPTPFLDQDEESRWFEWLQNTISTEKVGILSLLDYRKGLFNDRRTQRIIKLARDNNIPVYVDSRCQNLNKFKDATILKLNSSEYKAACKTYHCDSYSELSNKLAIDNIIETQGARGASCWSQDSLCSYRPDLQEREGSPDVTGCGDIFDVTFCYQWGINKVDIKTAIKIAVETATRFAYQPIGERLKCQN